MNAEEPVQTPEQAPLVVPAKVLPQQARVEYLKIPRPISVINSIFQWQPMGIRVTVQLPFVGDDWGFLFLIRNGPFIPRHDKVMYGSHKYEITRYAYNNLRNVFLCPKPDFGKSQMLTNYPEGYHVALSTYDYPPVLATLAQCFRRWRGDMQYRIRVVAGFGTQGYLIGSMLKHEHMPIGVYDEYKETPLVTRSDFSYRELMANGYVMSDTSMFRHLEVTVPYDYPIPWYDQYGWIDNRFEPNWSLSGKEYGAQPIVEPCGDNFLAIGVRGSIDAPNTTTMQFELEYRAVEGFQFSEPGLVPWDMCTSRAGMVKSGHPYDLIKIIPSKEWTSDGIGTITKSPKFEEVSIPTQAPKLPPPTIAGNDKIISSTSKPPVHPAQVVKSRSSYHRPTTNDIVYPIGHPLGPFAACAVDRRGGKLMTHCKREDGSWITYEGDVRTRIQAALVEEDLIYNLSGSNPLKTVDPNYLLRLAANPREPEFA
uniref:Structural protein n=1 Tax=Electric ant polycipivirus 1 TaxID=3003605 RepID=A0AA95E5Z7_9VIRU|nr:structural protein [Electric ant polycipivirus 1]